MSAKPARLPNSSRENVRLQLACAPSLVAFQPNYFSDGIFSAGRRTPLAEGRTIAQSAEITASNEATYESECGIHFSTELPQAHRANPYYRLQLRLLSAKHPKEAISGTGAKPCRVVAILPFALDAKKNLAPDFAAWRLLEPSNKVTRR